MMSEKHRTELDALGRRARANDLRMLLAIPAVLLAIGAVALTRMIAPGSYVEIGIDTAAVALAGWALVHAMRGKRANQALREEALAVMKRITAELEIMRKPTPDQSGEINVVSPGSTPPHADGGKRDHRTPD